MNNTVTGISEKIPDDLKDFYSFLFGDVIWIREQWQMYEELYGVEEYWNLIKRSAPMFFYMVDYLFIDNFILALSRLADAPQQKITGQVVENFTLETLLLKLDQRTHVALIKKLKPLLVEYQRKCATIRVQRMKRVAHSDFKTKMEADKHALPEVSRQIIEEALMVAEDYLNAFDPSSTVIKTEPLIINDLQRRQNLLALHFRSSHSIHAFSRRVGGRATPAARHALCASPITWLRKTNRLPWNTASTS
jgi:hypothetical protein